MVQPKVVQVTPLENYVLSLGFSNGEQKRFDVKPYLDMPFYKPLCDEKLFRTVHVGGISVQWANGVDISPHELYDDSI